MNKNDTVLSVKGSFSWGFTSNTKVKPANGKDGKKPEEENKEEVVEKKKLSKFITLRDINMNVKKGEFVTIIGDVGSGKTSLLQSIIGDMLYIPESEIQKLGGIDYEATQEEFDVLKNRLVNEEFDQRDPPIKIRGSISYVEQGSWIRNKTIQENIIFENEWDPVRYQ